MAPWLLADASAAPGTGGLRLLDYGMVVAYLLATAAIVDCSVWAASGSAQPPVLDFACVLLLAPVRNGGSAASWTEVAATMDLEFLGLTRNPGTPCATGGLAGGAYGPPVPTLVQ